MDARLQGLLGMVVLAGVLWTSALPVASAQSTDLFIADASHCNKTLNGTQGNVTVTPGHKGPCVITVQRNASAGLTTLQLSMVSVTPGDYVAIYDGNQNETSNLLVNITQDQAPVVAVAVSNNTYLVLQINADNSKTSIEGTYSTPSCQVSHTVTTSTLVQMPMYKPNMAAFNCTYTLSKADSSGSQTALGLSFLHTVSLPNATLTINSLSPSTPVTGKMLPPDTYSSDNFTMALSVDKANVSQNFFAVVSVVTASADCGQVKTVTNKTTMNIMVPQFTPRPYDCRFTLKANSKKSLSLNISSLQLLGMGNSLVIADGPSLKGSGVLASLTDSASDYLVLSGGQRVTVQLTVREIGGQGHLTMDVTELDYVGHLYQSGTVSITPPPANTTSTQFYVLQPADAAKVKMTLSEEKANKTGGYTISVYDGTQMSSPLLVTFSSATRVPVVSTGNSVLVVAELKSSAQPLNISFDAADPKDCSQVTSATDGQFQLMASPSIAANTTCMWTITSTPQSAATLRVDLTTLQLSKKASLSIYSGVSDSGSLVARFVAADSQPGAVLPAVVSPAAQWAQLVFEAGNSINLTDVDVSAMFNTIDDFCGGDIQDTHGHLRTPSFPDLYPLNSLCTWTLPPSSPGRVLFFDFPQFALAQKHSLQVEEKRVNSSQVMGRYGGDGAIASLLYSSNLTNTITFSAQPPPGSNVSTVSNVAGQGFDVEYWVLDCGGNFTSPKDTFSSAVNSSLCVWVVSLPPTSGQNVNIVNVTLTIKASGSASVKDMLNVYDGNNLRSNLISNISAGTNTILSRYNSLIIVYNATASANAAAASLSVSASYSTYSCAPKQLCKNKVCMHPDWMCNGIDNCGDNTDEQNCVGPPATVNQGMKPGIVVLLFFVGLALGVIIALVIPRIIKRVRTNRYHSFNNEPVSA